MVIYTYNILDTRWCQNLCWIMHPLQRPPCIFGLICSNCCRSSSMPCWPCSGWRCSRGRAGSFRVTAKGRGSRRNGEIMMLHKRTICIDMIWHIHIMLHDVIICNEYFCIWIYTVFLCWLYSNWWCQSNILRVIIVLNSDSITGLPSGHNFGRNSARRDGFWNPGRRAEFQMWTKFKGLLRCAGFQRRLNGQV